MTDAPFTLEDAHRRLGEVLDRAPKQAVRGQWSATTTQAGVSRLSGGYRDADGHHVDEPEDHAADVVREVVERLDASAAEPFNTAEIRWAKSRLPWRAGTVSIETAFDPVIVPRGPDHPAYEEAASARRRFWAAIGELAPEPALERGAANAYAQTKWFGPHRRVLFVRRPGEVLLATDGLSTPWAGISERENGVGCEVMLRLEDLDGALSLASEVVEMWAGMMLGVGDMVADGYRVLRDVEQNGAILFCRLPDECAPYARIILSVAPEAGVIEGLPFGSVRVVEATPVTEDEVVGRDPDEPWGATAARAALARRAGRPANTSR